MTMLPAARLRHRVTLQSKSVTRDAMGGETITWIDEATVWAEVRHLRTRDLVAAQANLNETTAVITVRHRADIQPDWRVKHGADIYTLTGHPVDGLRREFTELNCTLGTREG